MLKTFFSASLGLILLLGAISQAAAAVGPVQCQYFDGTTFVIDGSLSEWPAQAKVLSDITIADQGSPADAWPDTVATFSINVYTAWDADYLYMAYEVSGDTDGGLKTDDTTAGISRFLNDMFRIYLEYDGDGLAEEGAGAGEFYFDASASATGNYNIAHVGTYQESIGDFGYDSGNLSGTGNGTLAASVNADGDEAYVIEARLAWADLAAFLTTKGMTFTPPSDGAIWKFDNLFIDDDPRATPPAGVVNNGQFVTHTLNDPSTWDNFTFAGDPGSVDVPSGSVNLHFLNAGFDDQDPVSFVLSGSGGTITNESDIPGWRQVALGHGDGNFDEGTVSVVAEASAPSAPNVVQIDKTQAGSPSQFNLDRAVDRVTLTPGHVYRVGVFARDIDSTPENVNVHSPLFLAADGAFAGLFGGDATIATMDEWQLVAGQFTCPADVNGGYIETSPGQVAEAHYQMDSGGMYDVTAANRVINGDFENMAIANSAGLGWFASSAANNEMQAEIVTDAASGAKAARLYRAEFTADSVFTTVNIPWTGSNQPYLKISIKDDPTIATGEYLNVTIPPFKADGAFQGVQRSFNLASGEGEFVHYVIDDLDFSDYPADTAFVQLSLRIYDANGAQIPGDLIIDDVVLGDLTAGYAADINAVLNWTLY